MIFILDTVHRRSFVPVFDEFSLFKIKINNIKILNPSDLIYHNPR